jgi:hypothetical protein
MCDVRRVATLPASLHRFVTVAAMNITPTRLPGARAALVRNLSAMTRAVLRIPAWQGVTVVMACAAAAMVAVAPAPLLA